MHKYTKSTVCLLPNTDLVIQIPRQNPDSKLVAPFRVYTHCKFLSTIGSNTRVLGVFLRCINALDLCHIGSILVGLVRVM